jgi:hypothetical protein
LESRTDWVIGAGWALLLWWRSLAAALWMVAAAIRVAPTMAKVFRMVVSPVTVIQAVRKMSLCSRSWLTWRCVLPDISRAGFTIRSAAITLGRANFLAPAKYSAIVPAAPVDLPLAIRFNEAN